MRDPTWLFRLEHIIEFIDLIEKYLKDVDRESFRADRLLIDAVPRNLELIGEASTHVPPAIQKKYPELPWDEMRGLRIILAHNYMGADSSILWTTSQQYLKPLRSQILEIKKLES